MSSHPASSGWTWQEPPYFALIRGPLGRAGYHVATVHPDDRPEERIVLLFSSPDRAEAHGRSQPQGHADWKVGPLPTWKRLHFFLDSMRATASRVCVDFDRERHWENYSVPLGDALLADLEGRAERESASGGAAPD